MASTGPQRLHYRISPRNRKTLRRRYLRLIESPQPLRSNHKAPPIASIYHFTYTVLGSADSPLRFVFLFLILMTIEPFILLVALLPLAAYLTLFGLIRLTGRPMATSGGRDIFAVSVAISGLFIVGPAELFFPAAAGAAFGPKIWPAIGLLYFLLVALIILSARPKLIVYGLGSASLAEPLLLAAKRIDPTSICDEESGQIVLPSSGIHLRIDGHRGTDTAEVYAYENVVSPSFWRLLLRLLRAEIATEEASSPRYGGLVFVIGLAMLAFLSWQLFSSHEQVVQGFQEWLWR